MIHGVLNVEVRGTDGVFADRLTKAIRSEKLACKPAKEVYEVKATRVKGTNQLLSVGVGKWYQSKYDWDFGTGQAGGGVLRRA